MSQFLSRSRSKPLAIGIIGGMSPEATVTYYQHIVRCHLQEFGDHSYPRIVISSVSFQAYIEWQQQGDWQRIRKELEREFHAVAAAGADFAVLATNTMHKVLPSLDSPVPVLSILDTVADRARKSGVKSVALTGTRFTMSDGFYAEGMESRGLRVISPSADEQDAIHHIIYDELIAGVVNAGSVENFATIARSLVSRGAEAILLGCTELQMLTQDAWFADRILDSTLIHSEAAWRLAVRRTANASS